MVGNHVLNNYRSAWESHVPVSAWASHIPMLAWVSHIPVSALVWVCMGIVSLKTWDEMALATSTHGRAWPDLWLRRK